MNKPPTKPEYALIFALTLFAGLLVAASIDQPGYTDAYYYYNAAERTVTGAGLTDPYVALTYIGAPGALPTPSHLYWMPLTSLAAVPGMWLGGANFDAAQAGFVILWALLAVVAFGCGAWLGETRRHAWMAGLLTIFSGFFAPFWTTTDSFGPFGAAGALALVGMGRGRTKKDRRWFAFAGAMAGLAHLARADGLLFAPVLVSVALWPDEENQSRLGAAVAGLLAYLLVMAPWFGRNLSLGAPLLPAGGTATLWLRGYNEITHYPPDALTLQHFLEWGTGNIANSRLEAAAVNLQHFVAEQGLVIFAPFILVGLWRRRNDPQLSGVWLYALGLHLAMTFAFAYPGMRGGLFHSSAALLPFWFALGVLGLDDTIEWIAKHRRTWKAPQAKFIFNVGFLLMAAALTLSLLGARLPTWNEAGQHYTVLGDRLPDDAVVMVNDPAALYYHTGLAGVVVPNGDIEMVRMVAERYRVTHLVLDVNRPDPLTELFLGQEQAGFLEEIALLHGDDMRVFEVNLP